MTALAVPQNWGQDFLARWSCHTAIHVRRADQASDVPSVSDAVRGLCAINPRAEAGIGFPKLRVLRKSGRRLGRALSAIGLLCPLSRFLGAVVCSRTFFDAGFGLIYRAEERAAPKDVGDQTLMRGLCTAFPFMRPGLSLSKRGRRSKPAHSPLGSSPAVVPPSLLHD